MPITINGVTHPVDSDVRDPTGTTAGSGDLGTLAATAGARAATLAGTAETNAKAHADALAATLDARVVTAQATADEALSQSGTLDPNDPTGLTLLMAIPSHPSVSLSVVTDGWSATATFVGASPEGLTPLTFTINWGDGTAPGAATSPAVHTYPSTQADYTITITVTDTEGGTATDTATASVAPPGVSAYGAQVLLDDPVVFFPMTEEAPTFPLTDYTGTATMTVTKGTVVSEAIPIGGGPRSFKFHGAQASLGQPAALNSMTAWSFEIIARQTIPNRQGAFFNRSHTDGAVVRGVRLEWARLSALRMVGATPNSDVIVAPTYPTGMTDPTHFVGTYDGTTLRLYANGAQIGEAAVAGGTTPPAGVADWIIGLGDQYANLSGAAIYDHALSPTRIAAHAAAAGLS